MHFLPYFSAGKTAGVSKLEEKNVPSFKPRKNHPYKTEKEVIFGERFGEVSLKEKLENQDGILFGETVKAFHCSL